jgi:hypothetical protein
MGSSASIYPIIEVSFADTTTGQLLPKEKIESIIEQVSYDFKMGFYDKYKCPGVYDDYKKFLTNQTNK